MAQEIQPKLDELQRQWDDLERTTQDKGQRLFDANRHVLYEQSCDDIDGWINEIESQIVTEDVGHDLTTVNLLVQKQNVSACNIMPVQCNNNQGTVNINIKLIFVVMRKLCANSGLTDCIVDFGESVEDQTTTSI